MEQKWFCRILPWAELETKLHNKAASQEYIKVTLHRCIHYNLEHRLIVLVNFVWEKQRKFEIVLMTAQQNVWTLPSSASHCSIWIKLLVWSVYADSFVRRKNSSIVIMKIFVLFKRWKESASALPCIMLVLGNKRIVANKGVFYFFQAQSLLIV